MPFLLINHVAQQCAPVIELATRATPSVLEKVDLTLEYRQALFNLAFAIFSLEMKNCKELSSMPYQYMWSADRTYVDGFKKYARMAGKVFRGFERE